jgi:three-Cys-motif partner protein
MNYSSLISALNLPIKKLDTKQQQTDYKIKYITEYVRGWLIVSANRPIFTINFIDCMCNAGIYQDGDLCTSIEVLLLFYEFAKSHPDKHFNLFLNDIDEFKVKTCKHIIGTLQNTHKQPNVNVLYESMDVNDYLQKYDMFSSYLRFNCATVLFVDPYDFGTVHIEKLSRFLKEYYCELIFNLFTSDYVRNKIDARIRFCIGDAQINSKEELVEYVVQQFRVGKIKCVFRYEFRISRNIELYQIVFATPSIKGL